MRTIGLCLAGLLLFVTPAAADELLVLSGGFTLTVTAWRIEDDLLYLEFPDDGLVVVDQAVLLEARHADGPPGVITWRRETPFGPVERYADGSMRGARDASPRSVPQPARPGPTTARSVIGPAHRGADLRPATGAGRVPPKDARRPVTAAPAVRIAGRGTR